MKYVLAIDQSTQGTKAILFDDAGQLIRKTALNHRQIVNEKGWVEHDLDEILENVYRVCRTVVKESGIDASKIEAVGISNQLRNSCSLAPWHRQTRLPCHCLAVCPCQKNL